MTNEPDIKWHHVKNTWNGDPVEDGEITLVGLARSNDALSIRVDAPFHDDPPPDGPAGRTDHLWEYEVVEVFLLGDGDRYLELEVAPDRYLFLEFEGARQRTADDLPDVRWSTVVHHDQTPPRWTARIDVPSHRLPAGPLRWNAFACHGRGAGRRMLALYAQPDRSQPDFHDSRAYRLLPVA